MKINIIVLAGGKGTRMNTDIPKCAVTVLGKPMIIRILEELDKNYIDNFVIVVGYKKEIIENLLNTKNLLNKYKLVHQEKQLGTGDAVKKGLEKCSDGITVVLPGDMPFISAEIFERLISTHIVNKNDVSIVTNILKDTTGYGRILRDNNRIVKIIEDKNATKEQKNIKEVNTGLICFNTDLLCESINLLELNELTNEYYITDLIEKLNDKKIGSITYIDDYRLFGINSVNDLNLIIDKINYNI